MRVWSSAPGPSCLAGAVKPTTGGAGRLGPVRAVLPAGSGALSATAFAQMSRQALFRPGLGQGSGLRWPTPSNCFDARSDAAIRSLWGALDETGLEPGACHVADEPSAHHPAGGAVYRPEVDDALRARRARFPFGCRSSGAAGVRRPAPDAGFGSSCRRRSCWTCTRPSTGGARCIWPETLRAQPTRALDATRHPGAAVRRGRDRSGAGRCQPDGCRQTLGISRLRSPVCAAGTRTRASTICWWANLSCVNQPAHPTLPDILAQAREQVLERGRGLSREQVLEVLKLSDDRLEGTARPGPRGPHARWCGPEVEVEASSASRPAGARRTATSAPSPGCSPPRYVARGSTSRAWLRRPSRPRRPAPRSSASLPQYGPRRAAAGPGRRGHRGDPRRGGIHIACSLGMLQLRAGGAACSDGCAPLQPQPWRPRSFFPEVVTTHLGGTLGDAAGMVRDAGMEVCCGGILGMGRRWSSAPSSPPISPNSTPTRCR